MLTHVQNELFDLGANLPVPLDDAGGERPRLRVEPGEVMLLERACDQANAGLPSCSASCCPAGPRPPRLHLARTMCRRAERRAVALGDHAEVNAAALAYLDRLGDLLFILARAANAAAGCTEPLWRPDASTDAHAD